MTSRGSIFKLQKHVQLYRNMENGPPLIDPFVNTFLIYFFFLVIVTSFKSH